MRGIVQLFFDGLRCRTTALLVLLVQVLVASLVIAQALFLVDAISAASRRLEVFEPLSGWYQLNDTSQPAEFELMSASPEFETQLAQLLAWIGGNEDVELLVLPKTTVLADVGPEHAVPLHLVSRNLPRYFDLKLAEGVWLDAGRVDGRQPVVVGHSLADAYRPGDRLGDGFYIAGVLDADAQCFDIGAGMQPIPLDETLLTPFDGSLTDAGTLDGVLNGPVMRFRTDGARREMVEASASLGLYNYRFWRLDDFLRYYAQDLGDQIALYSAAAGVILAFALSAFLFGILRSISSRRREFGVHLAYGAAHTDFWLATSMEFVAVVVAGCVLPMALIGPPGWWAVAVAFLGAAFLMALAPAAALSRRSIPDLMRGNDG